MKPTTRWNWFKNTTDYTQGTFNKKWNQIKKKGLPTSPEHKANFANKCAALLFKYI